VNLAQELKDALKRQPPPPNMTERVMAAIKSRKVEAAPPSFWQRAGLPLAAAAALLLVVGVGVARQREAEREQGEAAARQLVTALRIASETLNEAKNEIKN